MIIFSAKLSSLFYFKYIFNCHFISDNHQIIWTKDAFLIAFENFYWEPGTLDILMNEQQILYISYIPNQILFSAKVTPNILVMRVNPPNYGSKKS